MTASAKAADVYAARRNRVLDAVPDATLCVVPSGRIMPRNGDADFPFRQDSTFHFLTGFNEPDALLLLWRGAEGAVCHDGRGCPSPARGLLRTRQGEVRACLPRGLSTRR